MPRIYMIRHGEAAAGWDSDPDPGLSALGHEQAEHACCGLLALHQGPLPVLSSPLKRCVETAMPLATYWGVTPIIERRVIELPSPSKDLVARTAWLRGMMQGTWDAVPMTPDAPADFAQTLADWRAGIAATLKSVTTDTVIFSHFVAVNAAAGHATGDDRVLLFRPDNASITIFDTDGAALRLVERGAEAETKVN